MSTIRLSYAETPALQPTTELSALAAENTRFPFTATDQTTADQTTAETWQASLSKR